MKTAAAAKSVDAIKAKIPTDPAGARADLSALQAKALKAIADGKAEDAAALAKECVRGSKLKFPAAVDAE